MLCVAQELTIGYGYGSEPPEGFDVRDVDVDAILEEESAQAQAEQEEYLKSLGFWGKILVFFQSIAAFFQELPAMFEAFSDAISAMF